MLSLVPFLLAITSMVGHAPKSTRTIDPGKSSVIWTGSKVAGSHTGGIAISTGTLTMDGDLLVAADITMNMASITCTDLTSEGSNAKLVSHLKGPDFFAVEDHPNATFRTRSVERISDSAGASTYKISGDLSIKGVTQTNTFEVIANSGPAGVEASGTIRFDRTKYGIRYGSGSFFDGLGDRMISDEVVLKFAVFAR
jgi:polyisoprenoid-binding protein YceI